MIVDKQSVITFLGTQKLTQDEITDLLRVLWLQGNVEDHPYLYRHLTPPENILASILLSYVSGDQEKIKILLEVFARAI